MMEFRMICMEMNATSSTFEMTRMSPESLMLDLLDEND